MEKCKLCEEDTNVTVEIKRVDYPLCPDCCVGVFVHMSKAYSSNRTVFDISEKKERIPVETHPEIAAEVLNYLFKVLMKDKNRPEYKADKISKRYLELISARVNEGHTLEELKAVAYFKWKEWKDDSYMKQFLRVPTLYGRQKFSEYLAEHAHKIPKMKAVNNTEQRKLIKELNSYGVKGEVNDETDRLAKELMKTGYENKSFLNIYLKEKI